MKRVAYLILCHTDPPQLERLTNALDHRADFFIHVDLKSDISAFMALSLPNTARFIEERERVSWGGFSIVRATVKLITAALEENNHYSHLVLLSGLDYPIKPASKICDFLQSHADTQFIRFFDVAQCPEIHLKSTIHYHFRENLYNSSRLVYVDKAIRKVMTALASPFKKAPLHNITHCFGSQWWAITLDCARYIMEYIGRHADLVRFYQSAHAPDELFFHTIVANSPFVSQTRGIEPYPGPGTYKLANLHFITKDLKKVFTEKDFSDLAQSKKYFVRKITSGQSLNLIKCIDAELLSR